MIPADAITSSVPRLRILAVHNRYKERGGEDSVFDDETSLLEGNVEVSRYVVDNRDMIPVIGPLGTALRLSWSRPSYRALRRKIAECRPDVVHIHNVFPRITLSAYDACEDARVPVVQTLHNFRIWCAPGTFLRDGRPCEDCAGGDTSHAVRHRCYRNSMVGSWFVARMQRSARKRRVWQEKISMFLALTPFARDKAVHLGLPAERVLIKPNFSPRPARAREGAGSGALFLGRLVPEKGVSTLIEAFRDPSAGKLTIAGSGPEAEALRSRASGLRHIEFAGAVGAEKAGALMCEAACLVVPSIWYEMFPRVVAEAMSRGLPVVASRIGSLPDIVRHEETGLLFDPGDAKGLRAACDRLARDREFNLRLGARSRAVYEQSYSPETNVRLLTEIYRRVRVPASPADSGTP